MRTSFDLPMRLVAVPGTQPDKWRPAQRSGAGAVIYNLDYYRHDESEHALDPVIKALRPPRTDNVAEYIRVRSPSAAFK